MVKFLFWWVCDFGMSEVDIVEVVNLNVFVLMLCYGWDFICLVEWILEIKCCIFLVSGLFDYLFGVKSYLILIDWYWEKIFDEI